MVALPHHTRCRVAQGSKAFRRSRSATAHSGTVTARTYTARHQLASVSHDGNAVAAFAYDPGMRETSRTLGSGAGVLTRTSTYARQDNLVTGQQVGTMHGGNDRPGLRWAYTYDANKNLLTATTGGVMAGVGFTTTQDNEDRLTGWTRSNGEASTWNLSDVGDWDSYTGQTFQAGLVAFNQQRTHNAVHELLQIDEGGTLTPIEHDAKGNITKDQFGNTYAYDFDNQLIEAKDSSGAVLGTYTYDALGRRTERTVAATGVTTAYVCLSDASGMGQVIAEYENGTLVRHTTYGSYVDEPLSLHVKSGTNAGNTYWYHADRQYNVLGLADAMGMVVERYSYTPYGARRVLAADGSTVLAASAFGNAWGHQGLWHDDETGLVYNRARYRSVTLGRWMGRDSLEYIDGLSLYQQLINCPYAYLDPTGFCPCDDLFAERDELLNQLGEVGSRIDNIYRALSNVDSNTAIPEGSLASLAGTAGTGLAAAGAYGAAEQAGRYRPIPFDVASDHGSRPSAGGSLARGAGVVGGAIDVARTGTALRRGDYVGAGAAISSATLGVVHPGLAAVGNATAAGIEGVTEISRRRYNEAARAHHRSFLGQALGSSLQDLQSIENGLDSVEGGLNENDCW